MLNTEDKALDLREKLDGRVLVGGGAMSTLPADRTYNRVNNLMPQPRRCIWRPT